jgi:hypothetical protein
VKQFIEAIAFLTWVALAGEAYGQTNLTSGMNELLNIFGPFREAYLRIVVNPAAKTQSITRLRKFSDQLGTLANDKRTLTEDVLSALKDGPPRSQARVELVKTANALRGRVRQVRQALTDVFEPLPSDLKQRGGDVQRALEANFTTKWENLDAIGKELRLDTPSLEAIKSESENMLKAIDEIRRQVDQLIQEISDRKVKLVPGLHELPSRLATAGEASLAQANEAAFIAPSTSRRRARPGALSMVPGGSELLRPTGQLLHGVRGART